MQVQTFYSLPTNPPKKKKKKKIQFVLFDYQTKKNLSKHKEYEQYVCEQSGGSHPS